MSVSSQRLDGENVGISLSAPNLSVDVITLNITTGAVASGSGVNGPFFTADDLAFLEGGAAELFALVPFGSRAAGALVLLGKLVQVSAADASNVTLTAALTAPSSYTLRATVAAAPASLLAHISHSIVGALTWSTGASGGGGGGAPSGPAGGVLGYPGSTYPNPNGLAGFDNGTGLVFDVPLKSPNPALLINPSIVFGFPTSPVPGENPPNIAFTLADGGTDTNPAAGAAPSGGGFAVQTGAGANAIEHPAGQGGTFFVALAAGGDAVDGGGLAPAGGLAAGNAGSFDLQTFGGGSGASDVNADGGNGGFFDLSLGDGGPNVIPAEARGGNGGFFRVVCGDGGDAASVDSPPGTRKSAGNPGYVKFELGAGGQAYDNAPLPSEPLVSNLLLPVFGEPAPGGYFEVTGGTGGGGANNSDGAQGGSIVLTPGDGGTAAAPPYKAGLPFDPVDGEPGRIFLDGVTRLGVNDTLVVSAGDPIGRLGATVMPLEPAPASTPVPGPRVTVQLAKAAGPGNPDLFATATNPWLHIGKLMSPGDLVMLVSYAPIDTGLSLGSAINMVSDDSVQFSGGSVTLRSGDTVTLMFIPGFPVGKFVEVARAIT